MRTTIVLDDALFQEAKKRAATLGQTLNAVIEAALRDALRARPNAPLPPFRVAPFGGKKKVSHEPADFAAALEEEDRARLRR